METIYKLTTQNHTTYGGHKWEQGIEQKAPGNGSLCSSAYLHGYQHPLLAALLNPVHACIENPVLWKGKGLIEKSDGLKVGCTSMVLLETIPLPVITTAQRVRFAIYVAYDGHRYRAWRDWAEGWLFGGKRSISAASRASYLSYSSASYAAFAASAARDAAADSTAYAAAYAAARAADAAADAAYDAAAYAADDAAAYDAAAYAARDARRAVCVRITERTIRCAEAAIRDEKE